MLLFIAVYYRFPVRPLGVTKVRNIEILHTSALTDLVFKYFNVCVIVLPVKSANTMQNIYTAKQTNNNYNSATYFSSDLLELLIC